MKKILLPGALAAVLARACSAQSEVAVDEVVVTASRVPQSASESLYNVNVITAQDIEQSGQHTLAEVLQSKGGVEITSNGGFGQPSAVRIRGAESRHTLVLIDGIRVDSATLGTTAFEHIPLSQISRIEVVPGPRSGLYGSDAIGGVVQIFTHAHEPGLRLYAGAGAYDTSSVSAGFAVRESGNEFSLNAGYFDSDGFSATKRSIPFGLHNPDKDGYRNKNFSAKLAREFAAGHEAGATAFVSDGTTEFDSGATTDDVNETQLSVYSLYSRNQFTPAWSSLLRIGQGRDDLVVTGAFPAVFRTRQNQFTWQNDFALAIGTITLGAEYLDQQVESTTQFAEDERDVTSFFAGYLHEFGNHALQLNARHDDNSQFGSVTTGSAGYGYRFTDSLRARASVGTAFKAPTFNDLYFPPSFFFSGNPNLEPERSRSFEAGLNFQSRDHRMSATYFDNRIRDIIVVDPITFSTVINLDRARIRGVELSYQGRIGDWQLHALAAFQDPENEETGNLLPRRAREFGSLELSREWGNLNAALQLVGSGERFDSSTENPATRIAGYALINLRAGYALSRELSLNARWSNVLNKDYELLQHFNTASGNLFFFVQYQTP
jgi:vitamin B12 transporter